ncbi:unnamed protein product [Penicillium roqueforti FM164]|uniref:Genomic scaffold, ProqFM164S04 n=1 Tax=Penicillium roqueforti (strain FM164) TaxID=1365484 RepID=W6QI82_PENRF|nr:unnamed protein product [Penicillium roqueforti FM164]
MPEREPRLVLPKMLGETITTYCPDPDDLLLSSLYRTHEWIIMERLSEGPCPITPEDFNQGMGSVSTTGTYLCRCIDDPGFDLAFICIYKEIPLDGTEFNNLENRKKQATIESFVELDALKKFTETECTATPKLLGYQINSQGVNDVIPRGYIIHLIFEKVRGEPLEFEEEILSKITGFDMAIEIDPEYEWTDINFVIYDLVLLSSNYEKYVPTANDITTDKYEGWRW